MGFEREHTLAGRTVVAGFEGTSLPDDIRECLSRGDLGGLILFKRNVESVEQVAGLLREAKELAGTEDPFIAAVDQEGGRVIRLREPLTVLPAARHLGNIDDPDLTYRAGRLTGLELKAIGFTLDFAPVLDVDTNPDSPVIGDRSYGGTVASVVSHGLAFARGLSDAGVHPCAKHFPGHGDATVDSHLSLPRVDWDLERLETVEMEPFFAWARAGLGPVMTAHVVYPSIDEKAATVSRELLTGQLKGRMGFKGPVFTDDLEMGAIGELGGPAAVGIETIKSGAHGLLVCRSSKTREEVVEALAREAADNPSFAMKLEVAARTIEPLGVSHGPPVDIDWIASPHHQKMQHELMEALAMETA